MTGFLFLALILLSGLGFIGAGCFALWASTDEKDALPLNLTCAAICLAFGAIQALAAYEVAL